MINTQFVTKWYGKHLPTLYNYINFALKSSEFAKHIAKDKFKSIEFVSDLETPGIDNGGVIYMPVAWYLKKYYTELHGIDENDLLPVMVAFHNGGQIHEAFHAVWTNLRIISHIEHYYDNVYGSLPKDKRLLQFSFNIIEDVYIENRGKIEYNGIYDFLDITNSVMFPENKLLEMLNELKVENIPNTLPSWKYEPNRKLFENNPILEPVVTILKRALEITLDQNERLDIAFDLYEELLKNSEGKKKSGDALSDEFIDELRKLVQNSSKDIRHTQEQIQESEVKSRPDSNESINKVSEKTHVTFELPSYGSTKLNSRYANFANYIQYALSKKPMFSLPKDKGNRILGRELYRIGLDQKVLTTKELQAKSKGKPQFVILIDSSGSMDDIYEEVVSAASSIFMSLKQNDIPVSVWAHTGYDRPEIYGVCSFNMPFRTEKPEITINPLQRLNHAVSIEMYNNFDGIAIDYVGKKFFGDSERFLLVLSDGSPNGRNYSGKEAIKHTKDVVNGLRKVGVNVYSFTLVKHIVERNNEIYGNEYNIEAYENLENQMKKLVTNNIRRKQENDCFG